MSQNLNSTIAVTGIDIDKNSFHIVGLDNRGAIALRQLCLAGVTIISWISGDVPCWGC